MRVEKKITLGVLRILISFLLATRFVTVFLIEVRTF